MKWEPPLFQVFANEVNAHRDQIIELDQTGNQLKFLSQKQDVVLIKNLLVSVQSRWEKVVQRSVERGRALDDARKRAKQVRCLEMGVMDPVSSSMEGKSVGDLEKDMDAEFSLLSPLLSLQFHEAWKKLIDWLEDAENRLDSELEISNDPDKIKLQLSKHKVGCSNCSWNETVPCSWRGWESLEMQWKCPEATKHPIAKQKTLQSHLR